jgi:hypothetical protein
MRKHLVSSGGVRTAAKAIALSACCIMIAAACGMGPKPIVVDEALSANRDRLEVKRGVSPLGKIWNYHFGDYEIVSSKKGWTVTTAQSNDFFGNLEEGQKTQKFSFVMKGPTEDTAQVNAAQNVGFWRAEIEPGLSMESNELLGAPVHCAALISMSDDPADHWTLVVSSAGRPKEEAANRSESFLTNGARKILLVRVTSNKDGTGSGLNSNLGFQFLEDGEAVGAVQYFSGALWGPLKNFVYLRRDLDPKTKLLLAAAMTAVLQFEMSGTLGL